MRCDDVRDLLEAYVLGACEADEQAMIAEHIGQCPDCQQLVRALTDTVHQLPEALLAAAPLPLPPALQARVLQALASASGTPEPETAPAVPSPAPRPGPWWRRPRTLGLVAATLLLGLSLASNIHLVTALAQERALRTGLATLVRQQEIVLEVVDSSKSVKRVLRPPGGGSSYGKVYTRPDLAHVVAMAARLPQPPPGQAYHLWVRSQGQLQLAGVMAVNSEGFGLLVFDADHNGPQYDLAQLTLQAEGSTTPAAPPVLRWTLPQ